MSSRRDTRSREHRVEIRASIEDVFRALTEAEEVVRWFAPEAEIEPREGGWYRYSWGEGMEAASRIAVWEPPRRLRLESFGAGEGKLELPLVEEYVLESDGERTVLRMVQSGIPTSADWDDFYEDTGRGWRMFFAGLRHYLERHAGRARQTILFMHPVGIAVEEAWRKLLGPDGLAKHGGLDGELSTGERRTLTTSFGEKLEVELLVYEPPNTLTVNIDNLEDSLLALDFERMAGRTFLYANLSTFRVPEPTVERLRAEWRRWLERLFPAPIGSTS